MAKRGHRRGAKQKWKGFGDREVAPVEIRHVGPFREAEPMSPEQAALLKGLCMATGATFNAKWTHAQAKKRIAQLQARKRRQP